jgi:hypothetical protein
MQIPKKIIPDSDVKKWTDRRLGVLRPGIHATPFGCGLARRRQAERAGLMKYTKWTNKADGSFA